MSVQASLKYSLDASLRTSSDASPGDGPDASLTAELDASPAPELDASPRAAPDARACAWCLGPLGPRDVTWCRKKCRQAGWRQRKMSLMEGGDGAPKRVAYADPPFPGMSWLYRDQPSYAGEVDHVALLATLSGFDGWALSTSAKALRFLLPLCPDTARVCVWAKPHGVSSKTRGLHNAWEPVIVVPARHVRPGVADWFSALPARGGGTLTGRKPQRFCAQLFRWLGLRPGDELADLFPGTGVVSAAWRAVTEERSA